MIGDIIRECDLHCTHFIPVHGGDINKAYCLDCGNEKFFLKINTANSYPGMFEKEQRGLEALRKSAGLVVPETLKTGSIKNHQYILMKWMNRGVPKKDFWENFGKNMAYMHRQTTDNFGWEEDNYIGSLVQMNTWQNSWATFYGQYRVLPMMKILWNSSDLSREDFSAAGNLCSKLEGLYPHESPALLHGDLWSGNYMVAENGYAAIYDPAVYYGHREMDIGMTNLFGGFDKKFYEAYNEIYPLEKGWQERLGLFQLYPILVHAVLFGGHYINSAKEILYRFQ